MDANSPHSTKISWKDMVDAHAKSGLSQKAFCAERNLSFHQFVYYRKIFKKQKVFENKPERFLPVKIKEMLTPMPQELRVILPNGIECFVPTAMEKNTVKFLLEVLRAC